MVNSFLGHVGHACENGLIMQSTHMDVRTRSSQKGRNAKAPYLPQDSISKQRWINPKQKREVGAIGKASRC